ncbi:hypothetical protein QFC22_004818 [Naganishia vaughanmartiniae]|uniref:Uncharacterized protein n=1 Tax=Naganishia vaughanmartiniae TaxID=1424756 RepID=A0ACC2WXK7_9TREE|nr:hypothetical protein QFC22_004818 [Naganishia vaughanmartiniae]
MLKRLDPVPRSASYLAPPYCNQQYLPSFLPYSDPGDQRGSVMRKFAPTGASSVHEGMPGAIPGEQWLPAFPHSNFETSLHDPDAFGRPHGARLNQAGSGEGGHERNIRRRLGMGLLIRHAHTAVPSSEGQGLAGNTRNLSPYDPGCYAHPSDGAMMDKTSSLSFADHPGSLPQPLSGAAYEGEIGNATRTKAVQPEPSTEFQPPNLAEITAAYQKCLSKNAKAKRKEAKGFLKDHREGCILRVSNGTKCRKPVCHITVVGFEEPHESYFCQDHYDLLKGSRGETKIGNVVSG